jgi:hypothetical protein
VFNPFLRDGCFLGFLVILAVGGKLSVVAGLPASWLLLRVAFALPVPTPALAAATRAEDPVAMAWVTEAWCGVVRWGTVVSINRRRCQTASQVRTVCLIKA